MKTTDALKTQIRRWIIFFMIGLLLSGLTAFPLETELKWLTTIWPNKQSFLYLWLSKIYFALKITNQQFPYLAYGYDWLAFAHIVIATVFIGPLKDPIKNIWVIQFGCIACIMVFPLAFIAGAYRHIPILWRLIDCSFGVIGIIPLLIVYAKTRRLQQETATPPYSSAHYYNPLD